MESNAIEDIMKIPAIVKENNLDRKYEELEHVILFIGKTGNGKSTLVEFLTGNPDLRSVGENGEYTIKDSNGRIGDATILSQTSFPEPVWKQQDSNEKICYLDCPGFQDTRSSTMDIRCTYFTKKALKSCSCVKLVLVISYDEVKIGGQRSGFLELVKHVTEFVQNPNQFRSSIALFVTKVPNLVNQVDGVCVPVTEDNFKANIVVFLENTKKTMQDQIKCPKEKQTHYKNALTLIDILLDSQTSSSRIGILRCPNEAGNLQSIPSMHESVLALNDLIENVLEFTQSNHDNFGYTISADSKNYISQAVSAIIAKTATPLGDVLEEINRNYVQFEDVTENIETVYRVFEEHDSLWETTNQELQTSDTAKVLRSAMQHMDKLYSSQLFPFFSYIRQKVVSDLVPYVQLIEFLEMVSKDKFKISASPWVRLFAKVGQNVRTAKTWYTTVPYIVVLLKHAKGKTEVKNFMEILKRCIFNRTSLSGKKFTHIFNNIFSEDTGLKIDFDIDHIKLKQLERVANAALESRLDVSTINFLKGTAALLGPMLLVIGMKALKAFR